MIRRAFATVVPLALLAAACGGGDDDADTTTPDTTTPVTTTPETTVPVTAAPTTTASPTTVPATTAPATTAAPTTAPATTAPSSTMAEPFEDVEFTETIDVAGFVSISLPDGWSVRSQADELAVWYEEVPGLDWEPDPESIETLLAAERDGVEFIVFREMRYGLVDDVFAWDDAIGEAIGITPNIDLTVEWGGGRGESTRGTQVLDGETLFVRHESVAVGDQVVSVAASSPEQPTEALDNEVSAMIDAIDIDPLAVSILNHTLNTKVTVSAENTGGVPFEYSLLAPPQWIPNPDDSLIFEPRDPDQDGYIEYFAALADVPFADAVQAEMDGFGRDWLDVDPVAEETEIDGHPAVVMWEGPPEEATAAIVFVTDDVVFAGSYLWTPGNADLLQAMVESAIVPESAIAD